MPGSIPLRKNMLFHLSAVASMAMQAGGRYFDLLRMAAIWLPFSVHGRELTGDATPNQAVASCIKNRYPDSDATC